MDRLVGDIRYGFCTLLRDPGFTTIAVLTLALAIGANIAIFSVLNSVLLRPLPYRAADRLVMVWKLWGKGAAKSLTSYGIFRDWRERNEVFEDVGAYVDASSNPEARFDLNSTYGVPERIWGARVSANLFELLGVRPAFGRTFSSEEEKHGRDHVVILGDQLWRRRFGSDPNVTGKELRLNDETYVIVGVAPSNFKLTYPKTSQLFVPLTPPTGKFADRRSVDCNVIARLKPGVSQAQAQRGMDALSFALEQEHPESDRGDDIVVTPLGEEIVGNTRQPLFLITAAVFFVLLIACANIANITLARTAGRVKEIAVRAALGASRARLIQQLLVESILISLMGGISGLLLAWWSLDLLTDIIPPTVPRADEIGVDGRVLGITLAAAVLTGVTSGIFPALQLSKPDLSESLKEGSKGSTTTRSALRLRDALVVSEFALALLLLVGAGLMIRSLLWLKTLELGFDPGNVLTMKITLPVSRYATEDQWLRFFGETLDRISSLPGVQQAGTTTAVPLEGVDNMARIRFKEQSQSGAGPPQIVKCRTVNSRFFDVMRIPIARGSSFSPLDDQVDRKVAIINAEMARRYFANDDPIGQHLIFHNSETEIIGLVGDVRYGALAAPEEPAIYIPHIANPTLSAYVVARVGSNPAGVAAAAQEQVWAVDRDQPVENISTMVTIVSDSMSSARFYVLVLGSFGAVALVLAAVGIYGVMSYTVTQRTREIGIRMAIGAGRGNVLKLVLSKALILSSIGVVIGLTAAFVLTRLMSNLLYGVSATEPITFAAMSSFLTGVATIASFLPALRATRVPPIIALRQE